MLINNVESLKNLVILITNNALMLSNLNKSILFDLALVFFSQSHWVFKNKILIKYVVYDF